MRPMKIILSLALLALPAVAAAHGFDKPAPPLEDLLGKSRAARKPVLLDFSAVW